MSPSPFLLSVIIPAKNEALYLPELLRALQIQTTPATEIIVADAGSSDATAEIARRAGAIVVPGGKPAAGRNTGARVAQGNWLLFLDADVLPPPDFIARAWREIQIYGLDVASSQVAALDGSRMDSWLHEATNFYLRALRPVAPHAVGCCIFIRRSLHHLIAGYDETAMMAEDHDYVRRAGEYGKYQILTSVRLPVSVRRMVGDGYWNLAGKYLWAELHVLAGRPVRWMPFTYADRRNLVEQIQDT